MKQKSIIKIICAILSLMMLAGCTPPAEQPDTPAQDTLLTIIDGTTDYSVVRGETCDKSVINAAATLRTSLIAATGVEVGIKTDLIKRDEQAAETAHEILVGKTNRPESDQVYATLGDEEYAISILNESIVIIGKTDKLTITAVEVFINEILQYNAESGTYGITSLKLEKDYNMKRTYEPPLLSIDQSLVNDMALCVTEGSVPLDKDSIFARFEDYKNMGVTCVRIDMYWSGSGSSLAMQSSTKYHLEAARQYGLKLKLIINPGGSNHSAQDSKLMDASGRYSINAISPWYKDAQSYTEQFVRNQLKVILSSGYEDVIAGIVAGLGPAGEPLYPPAWTQGNGSDEVMWCYADNAQADFRAEMEKKYGDIAKANKSWGTNYSSFSAVSVPKEGEVRGKMWNDVLTWYRDSKREFMTMQVDVFQALMQEYEISDIPLILYLPGADYTQKQWDACVSTGTAINGIKFMCDNEFTVQLAAEKGCILQYTGITGTSGLKLLRDFMFENDYAYIPVMGENAGGSEAAAQAKLLHSIITEYKLWGIDYTHSHWLYEADGKTPSAMHEPFEQIIPQLTEYLKTVDITVPSPVKESVAEPDGDVLAFEINFNKPENEKFAFAFASIKNIDFTIQDGDTLEYDVYLSEDMAGIGGVDGIVDGGRTLRDNFGMTDSTGLRVHPNADLSDAADGEWYHRVIKLGNASSDGAVLKTVQLAAHPEVGDGQFTECDVTVYYDNIVIKRNGEIVCTIFESDGDVTLGKAGPTQFAQGTVSIADASDAD